MTQRGASSPYVSLGRAEDPILYRQGADGGRLHGRVRRRRRCKTLVADPLEKRLQELQWYDHGWIRSRGPGQAADDVVRCATRYRRGRGAGTILPGTQETWRRRRINCRRARSARSSTTSIPTSISPSMPSKGHGLPERLLARQAETVRQRLLHVPGVKKVDIVGERPERIFVNFDYARLATLGRGPQDVCARRCQPAECRHRGRVDRHQWAADVSAPGWRVG